MSFSNRPFSLKTTPAVVRDEDQTYPIADVGGDRFSNLSGDIHDVNAAGGRHLDGHTRGEGRLGAGTKPFRAIHVAYASSWYSNASLIGWNNVEILMVNVSADQASALLS